MIDLGKKNLLGVAIDAVDYEAATHRIITAAHKRKKYSCAALAVHGVMTGVLDSEHRHRLNGLDLAVPDGQPVRWGLNLLHRTHLADRVYGPTLTLHVCRAAAKERLPIYIYGSRPAVADQFAANLVNRYKGLEIVGIQPSLFRRLSLDEYHRTVKKIRDSRAAIVLVGLGCPRQEVWVYEFSTDLGMPTMAVGAAFDFHAGLLKQAPEALQRLGFEWAFRLACEPRRLWRRYLFLNPLFLSLLSAQYSGIRSFPLDNTAPPDTRLLYG